MIKLYLLTTIWVDHNTLGSSIRGLKIYKGFKNACRMQEVIHAKSKLYSSPHREEKLVKFRSFFQF